MADLQELFSRLKSPATSSNDQQGQQQHSHPSIWAQPQPHSYQQPSVSSPLFSPPIHTPNPQHHSAIMSPSLTPAPGDNKSNDLLNLLKFNSNQMAAAMSPLASLQNIASQNPSPQLQPVQQQSRSVSANDLVASFNQKPSSASSLRISMPSPQPEQKSQQPLGDAQNFLLGLLNRPKNGVAADSQPPAMQPAQAPETIINEPTPSADAVDPQDPSVRLFGSAGSRETTPFEGPSSAKKPVFTYINPFEQMTASSPKPALKADGSKHQRDVSQPEDNDNGPPNAKNRKITSSIPSPSPSPRPAQPSADAHQSVSEALSGIGEKVDKQVEKALAQAQADGAMSSVSKEQTKATEEVADSWESADANESGKDNKDFAVHVYNFPMRPFVSITINKDGQATPLRSDSLMDIARLKKEFEQIDRALVTASPNHIVYAMAKAGGFRVIRQDSGKDKQVFRSTAERVFNVQICTASGTHKDIETVLATGVNGSVFWTSINKVEGDSFDDLDLESQGFVLPPVPVQDDNTSGSPVKTRAKMSSRNAEFFAISRGKSIYIISPFVARQNQYTDKKSRVVDNDKYLQERCLKISTGKAGKDFAFSGDDSLLASLDKSGRIKFWDIRDMAQQARETVPAGKRPALERKDPLLTLTTTLPAEKATPSSIMFVDKERPCVKGVALRYLLVGLKQNHILQLWDLGLNKPVQELYFPHDKDSDAICSISYHPKTGIIALGHPTRNSIYFIHLSAPRYNIPSMDQARYTTMLAEQDPNLPRPESTAIMSGIRELSFASKGQLRSVDMLHTPVASETSTDILFELYAMHSKGVTCMNIKHEDLGWSRDNKVLHPVDAEASGLISVAGISPNATTAEAPGKSAKAAAPASPQKSEPAKPVPAAASKPVAKQEPVVNGTPKVEKPKKAAAEQSTAEPATNPAILTPASYALAARPKASSTETTSSAKEPAPAVTPSPVPAEKPAKAAEVAAPVDTQTIDKAVSDAVSREIESLYRRLDDDKRVQDAAAAAKQDAVLRLVSSTLTDNVEKTLNKIIATNITSSVIPAIVETSSTLLNEKLTSAVSQHVAKVVPGELKASLAPAISAALQEKELQRVISEQTASKLAPQIEQSFATVLRNSIVPNFTSLAQTSTKKAVADVERRFTEQLRDAEVQRQKDNAKIEQLSDLVLGLSKTIHEMAAGQSAFQEQILKLQRQIAGDNSARSAVSTEADVVPSIEDPELDGITNLMTQGRYEEGTIQWLQSERQGELFDKLFVRINPAYLQRLSPLVSLSVSAALTSSFEQNVDERLQWLSAVLSTINLNDAEIREVAPKIMDVLQQRMQGAYMSIAENNVQDPALRIVSGLSRQINDIKNQSLIR
ncbi:MAG: DNA-directed RNA polymerase [Aureobasidium pullulans]|nr:MAG: DNA-directed RNA polymerase [Aureobasidium pullulans]